METADDRSSRQPASSRRLSNGVWNISHSVLGIDAAPASRSPPPQSPLQHQVEREGWANKAYASGAGPPQWQRRYFRLSPAALHYYASDSSQVSLGYLMMLPSVEAALCDGSRSKTLRVACRGIEMEPLLLQVGSVEEAACWIDTICTACRTIRQSDRPVLPARLVADAGLAVVAARMTVRPRATGVLLSTTASCPTSASCAAGRPYSQAPHATCASAAIANGNGSSNCLGGCVDQAAVASSPAAADDAGLGQLLPVGPLPPSYSCVKEGPLLLRRAPPSPGSGRYATIPESAQRAAWLPCWVVLCAARLHMCTIEQREDAGETAADAEDRVNADANASITGATDVTAEYDSGALSDASRAVPAEAEAMMSVSLSLRGAGVARLAPDRSAPLATVAEASSSSGSPLVVSEPSMRAATELLLSAPSLPSGVHLRAASAAEAEEWQASLLSCGAAGSCEGTSEAPLSEAPSTVPPPPPPALRVTSSPSVFGSGHGVTTPIKHLVSKKKVRFQKDGYDLDLAYITSRFIAMGYPALGAESLYRNPAPQVKAFLAQYHHGSAKVYNLCAERTYEASMLGLSAEQLEHFAAFDHNPCPLFLLLHFCHSVRQWLAKGDDFVAAVHCKAGKGRTGLFICSYLVWSRECSSAEEALALFGRRRTSNGKGVTIPSQRRYVHYVDKMCSLDEDALRLPPLLVLKGITIFNQPEHLAAGIYFRVELVLQQGVSLALHDPAITKGSAGGSASHPRWQSWCVFDSRKQTSSMVEADTPRGNSSVAGLSLWLRASVSSNHHVSTSIKCSPNSQPMLAGDVKISVYSARGKICQFWFHTAFVKDGHLRLSKAELDKACKDKKALRASFAVELTFSALAHLPAAETTKRREELRRSVLNSRSKSAVAYDVDDVDDDDDDDEDD